MNQRRINNVVVHYCNISKCMIRLIINVAFGQVFTKIWKLLFTFINTISLLIMLSIDLFQLSVDICNHIVSQFHTYIIWYQRCKLQYCLSFMHISFNNFIFFVDIASIFFQHPETQQLIRHYVVYGSYRCLFSILTFAFMSHLAIEFCTLILYRRCRRCWINIILHML